MNSSDAEQFPKQIKSESELDEIMTRPSPSLVKWITTLESPLVIVGAAGKMGPSLTVQLKRAADTANHNLKIIAVSRYSDPTVREWIEERGIQTLACDLLQRESLADLPDAPNIINLVGLKFGTAQNPSLTWAVNTLVPAHVTERYPKSRIVALSTGNVYPMVSVKDGGSIETDPITPIGEYANAAVARERLFEYHSHKFGTRIVLLRLNYAVDMRYGVLLEIAKSVWAEKPVDVKMGFFNCIWQGDANEMIIRSLDLAESPPAVFNLTGPEVLSVRKIAGRFGELMNRSVRLDGQEETTALLSDSSRLCNKVGEPPTSLDHVLQCTAHWVMHGGKTYGKSTHFQIRDGKY